MGLRHVRMCQRESWKRGLGDRDELGGGMVMTLLLPPVLMHLHEQHELHCSDRAWRIGRQTVYHMYRMTFSPVLTTRRARRSSLLTVFSLIQAMVVTVSHPATLPAVCRDPASSSGRSWISSVPLLPLERNRNFQF